MTVERITCTLLEDCWVPVMDFECLSMGTKLARRDNPGAKCNFPYSLMYFSCWECSTRESSKGQSNVYCAWIVQVAHNGFSKAVSDLLLEERNLSDGLHWPFVLCKLTSARGVTWFPPLTTLPIVVCANVLPFGATIRAQNCQSRPRFVCW